MGFYTTPGPTLITTKAPTLKRVIPILASALLALALFGAAAAAPVKSPNAEPFDVECDNGEDYTIVVIGRGQAAAHSTGPDKTVFVPVSFSFKYFVEGEHQPAFDEEHHKGNPPRNRELISCTFSFEFEEPGVGTVQAEATVVGFIPPGKQ